MSRMSDKMTHFEVVADGNWEECIIDGCEAMFFRHSVGDKRFDLGDKLGICPICLFNKKMANGTLPKVRDVIINYHHKSIDSKPEKNSL